MSTKRTISPIGNKTRRRNKIDDLLDLRVKMSNDFNRNHFKLRIFLA
jgi:hypothetical protein